MKSGVLIRLQVSKIGYDEPLPDVLTYHTKRLEEGPIVKRKVRSTLGGSVVYHYHKEKRGEPTV